MATTVEPGDTRKAKATQVRAICYAPNGQRCESWLPAGAYCAVGMVNLYAGRDRGELGPAVQVIPMVRRGGDPAAWYIAPGVWGGMSPVKAAAEPPRHVWIRCHDGRLARFDLAGRGAFPYPCGHADKRPQAAVYIGPGGASWLCDADSSYTTRAAEFDGLETLPTEQAVTMTLTALNAKLAADGFTPSAAAYESGTHVYAFSVESLGAGTFGHPARTYCWHKPTGRLIAS